jgi:hypothetical protein
MIQANELRVGDWVKRNDLDGVYTVRAVCIDRIHPIQLIEHDNLKNVHYACQCTLSELEPIPLEEDMLIKSGFVFDGEYYEHLVLGSRFLIYEGENIDEYRLHFTSRKFVSVTYLHQLQNLFFFLTGQELNINL